MTPAGRAAGAAAALLACLHAAALTVAAGEAAAADGRSRAAWWLARDGVQPIAELVNTAGPGKAPAFRDRVGAFTVKAAGRAVTIEGSFPKATVWRFDLATFDGQFDMRRLYVPYGCVAFPDRRAIHTQRLTALLGSAEKALTHTGPWEIFNGEWLVPTARVALDERHVYTSWFDLPSLADQRAGRVYASFALEIDRPGPHAVRVSFDDFPRHTRWRPSRRRPKRPEVTHTPNVLRPHHVGSIAIGVDERVGLLEDVALKEALLGRHPRLDGKVAPAGGAARLGPDDPKVRKLIDQLDPDRGELWEYTDDAESMASGNDMDAGRKGLAACRTYDRLLPALTGPARTEVDRAFRKRFAGMYRYFVFQRNYNATGYAQNHSSKAVWGLLGAGLAWDAPEAPKWLRWAVMVCRQRVELLGRDGGLEWMNEGRDYGLGFWETSRRLILDGTGRDLAKGGFFENEWRYALHNAPAFPAGRVPTTVTETGTREGINVPLPAGATPANTPLNVHFDDCDQVYLRTGWGADALRVRLTAGSVFGQRGTPKALRYNWAHCPVNRGSIALWKGAAPILNEPGWDRTYRKTAGNNNGILVNGTDQWGGGQVWHPRLGLDQVGRVAFFADGELLCAARADLAGAYPPAARLQTLSRAVVQLKGDHFLVFDRIQTRGPCRAEWRFHAAFVEPLGQNGRFAAFGFTRRPRDRKKRTPPATFDEAFAKAADATCQVAFLTPGVAVDVSFSDTYFRGHAFRQPTRRLRVVRQGPGGASLLTALAPEVRLAGKAEGVYAGRRGDVEWTVLAGAAAGGGLKSDAHFAVAARNVKTGAAEAYRFGGTRLLLDGVSVDSPGPDVFAAVRAGRCVRTAPARP